MCLIFKSKCSKRCTSTCSFSTKIFCFQNLVENLVQNVLLLSRAKLSGLDCNKGKGFPNRSIYKCILISWQFLALDVNHSSCDSLELTMWLQTLKPALLWGILQTWHKYFGKKKMLWHFPFMRRTCKVLLCPRHPLILSCNVTDHTAIWLTGSSNLLVDI